MKFLKCKICENEVEIVGNNRSIKREVNCQYCDPEYKEQDFEPEVIIRRKID